MKRAKAAGHALGGGIGLRAESESAGEEGEERWRRRRSARGRGWHRGNQGIQENGDGRGGVREKLAADLTLALSLASWGRQASLIEGGRGVARGGWWRWGSGV